MVEQSGMIPKLKAAGEPKIDVVGLEYGVSYHHLFEENRYLRAKIGEVGRDYEDLIFTELEDFSAEALGETRKLVFVTDDNGNLIFRYLKDSDMFYVEDVFFKGLASKFQNAKPIKGDGGFEKLISEFSEEFLHVFQQDDKLRGYLDNSLRYFKDDFTRLDSNYWENVDKNSKVIINS